jgi:hypothetical protein
MNAIPRSMPCDALVRLGTRRLWDGRIWRARAKGAGMDHLWHIVMAASGTGAVLGLTLGFALRGK